MYMFRKKYFRKAPRLIAHTTTAASRSVQTDQTRYSTRPGTRFFRSAPALVLPRVVQLLTAAVTTSRALVVQVLRRSSTVLGERELRRSSTASAELVRRHSP